MSGNLFSMKAALLTVGTEITSGEIVNRNAADLAQKLDELNIETIIHLSVPDERPLILKACDFVKESVDIIIFTGGLGPTSDDFTREMIAEWTGKKLEFHQEVYEDLQHRFKKMGRDLKSGHKQQCYFPQDAVIYPNNVGHALPFKLKALGKIIFALPGPPREIEGIWQDSLKNELQSLNLKPEKYLFKWKCFGKGESEFAEMTEEIFKDSGFTLGYRATIPYVYIKVWIPKEKLSLKESYFSRFHQVMSQWIVEEGHYEALAKNLNSFKEVNIFDSVSEGKILKQMIDGWPKELLAKSHYHSLFNIPKMDGVDFKLGVKTMDDFQWMVFCEYKNKVTSEVVTMPYGMKVYSQRSQLYITEVCAKIWNQQVESVLSN